MAEPIVKLTRGIPKTDREWNDVLRNLGRYFKIQGETLIIDGTVTVGTGADLPDSIARTNQVYPPQLGHAGI